MKEVFYGVVEIITQLITGYDCNNLKIWELGKLLRYMEVSEQVATALNIVIVITIISVIINIVGDIHTYCKNSKKQDDKSCS